MTKRIPTNSSFGLSETDKEVSIKRHQTTTAPSILYLYSRNYYLRLYFWFHTVYCIFTVLVLYWLTTRWQSLNFMNELTVRMAAFIWSTCNQSTNYWFRIFQLKIRRVFNVRAQSPCSTLADVINFITWKDFWLMLTSHLVIKLKYNCHSSNFVWFYNLSRFKRKFGKSPRYFQVRLWPKNPFTVLIVVNWSWRLSSTFKFPDNFGWVYTGFIR